jgi:uncharacterized membrane protein (UPF0127 family)
LRSAAVNVKALRNITTGQVIAARARLARGFYDRVIAYLAGRMDPQEALWFPRRSSVNTRGMQEPIDLVFLDDEDRVVRVVCAVPPNQPDVVCSSASSVIKLAAGALERTDVLVGDHFSLQ